MHPRIRRAQVHEEQRLVEAITPSPPSQPQEHTEVFDIMLIVQGKNGSLSLKPARGQDIWFHFELARAGITDEEVLGFIRKRP